MFSEVAIDMWEVIGIVVGVVVLVGIGVVIGLIYAANAVVRFFER